jgi:cyanophycinase
MVIPKGKLIAIGGAEHKGDEEDKNKVQNNNHNFSELGILKRIVEETGKTNPTIEVVTTASMIPLEVGQNYLCAFGKIEATQVYTMHIRNRDDAAQEEYLSRLRKCDVVMFSGGNQMRLSSIFGGTEFLKIITERYYNEDFVIAGTSAGAMAMSNTMIYEGNAAKAHLKGEVKITTGLALMDNVIFDSHFEKRGRFARLAQAIAANPGCIGIGLGEDTGMLITEGNKMEAIGSGLVVIVDGHHINHCNIADIPEGNPISIENIAVHFCEMGNGYWVKERKFIPEVSEGAVIKKQVTVI